MSNLECRLKCFNAPLLKRTVSLVIREHFRPSAPQHQHQITFFLSSQFPDAGLTAARPSLGPTPSPHNHNNNKTRLRQEEEISAGTKSNTSHPPASSSSLLSL